MEEKKKNSKLGGIIAFILIIGIFGGGGFWYLNNHMEDIMDNGGKDMDEAVEMYYNEEDDQSYTDDIAGFYQKKDTFWVKYVSHSERPKWVNSFIHSGERKMYKKITVYDETGENVVTDKFTYNADQDRYESEPFYTKDGEVYYIKYDIGEHYETDSIFTIVEVKWDLT